MWNRELSLVMQDISTYKAEHSAIRASNNKLHTEIWMLSQRDKKHASVTLKRAEIEANTRRLRTIEYLMRWLKNNQYC